MNRLRPFVTVKLPYDLADTLIQCPVPLCAGGDGVRLGGVRMATKRDYLRS